MFTRAQFFSFISATFLLLGLAKGDMAPDFEAPNQDGKSVQLSKFRGKNVVLFFYPKDETPGCTREACNFRDAYSKIQSKNTVVLGVSRQDSESHLRFQKKHGLPFDLLVDQDGSIAKAFGVDMMPVLGLHHRNSFLISADGKIVKIYRDVDPKTHTQEVLKDISEMKAEAKAATQSPQP